MTLRTWSEGTGVPHAASSNAYFNQHIVVRIIIGVPTLDMNIRIRFKHFRIKLLDLMRGIMPPHYGGALPSQQSGIGSNQIISAQPAHLTRTAMGRWSVLDKQMPPVDQIKTLHIYDFDNTRETMAPAESRSFPK